MVYLVLMAMNLRLDRSDTPTGKNILKLDLAELT
jgi:hypothetical protein